MVVIEKWECNECGLPCKVCKKVEIHHETSKLPSHVTGEWFRDRRCPCREATPNWKEQEQDA